MQFRNLFDLERQRFNVFPLFQVDATQYFTGRRSNSDDSTELKRALKKAHRKLATKLHPDRVQCLPDSLRSRFSQEATALMQQVNAIHGLLEGGDLYNYVQAVRRNGMEAIPLKERLHFYVGIVDGIIEGQNSGTSNPTLMRDLETRLKRIEGERDSARAEADGYRQERDDAYARMAQERTQVNQAKEIYVRSMVEHDDYRQKVEQELTTNRAQIAAQEKQIKSLEEALAKERTNANDRAAKLATAESNVEHASKLIGSQAIQLKETEQQRDSAERRYAELEKTSQKLSSLPEDLYAKIKQLRDSTEFEKALTLCDTLGEINPQDVNIAYLTATVHERKDDLITAISSYQRALELNPQHRWAQKGVERVNEKITKKIKLLRDEKTYDSALEHCKAMPETSFDRNYLEATIYQRRGQEDVAEVSYNKALEKRESPAARRGLEKTQQLRKEKEKIVGEIVLARDKKDYTRAIELCDKITQETEDDYQAFYLRGTILQARGCIEEAKMSYTSCLKILPGYKRAQERIQMLNF